MFLNIYL